jgi:class 3 adenylate cyclase
MHKLADTIFKSLLKKGWSLAASALSLGSVVNMAARLERLSSGEDVIISEAVRHDPEVEELLSAPQNQFVPEPFEAQLKGFDEAQFELWRAPRGHESRSGDLWLR